MAAFWAVFTFGGSGPALTAHGSLDLKQEIHIHIHIHMQIIDEMIKITDTPNQSELEHARSSIEYEMSTKE
jgi:hypothetical protein